MNAWTQTATGRAIDLLAVDLSCLDVAADIAVPLAGLARFNGHQDDNRDGAAPIYSVAQHCCVGADAVLEETGSVAAALAFLIHDGHEALIGDITTPTAQAIEGHLATVLHVVFGLDAIDRIRTALGGDPFAAALAGLKGGLDRHIHRLAGLPDPLPPSIIAIVRDMDRRMLDLERRQILGEVRDRRAAEIWPAAVLAARPVRLRGRLRPWPSKRAAAEWMRRFDAWRIRPAVEIARIAPDRSRGRVAKVA